MLYHYLLLCWWFCPKTGKTQGITIISKVFQKKP
nr:MAG TPA: Putative collagen-binding domain of a collagenase [Caudoviricetes sp.]